MLQIKFEVSTSSLERMKTIRIYRENHDVTHFENKFVFKIVSVYMSKDRPIRNIIISLVAYRYGKLCLQTKMSLSSVLDNILKSIEKGCFKAVALTFSIEYMYLNNRTNSDCFLCCHDIG